MDQTLSKFFTALTEQEQRFIPYLATDNLGIALRCAINELDWQSYRLSQNGEVTQEQEEEFYLRRLGVARLVKLALCAHASFDAPTLTFRRTRHVSELVLQLVDGFGILEHGRRIAQSVGANNFRIEQPQEDEFLITLPEVLPDEDFYERYLLGYYRNEARHRIAEILQSDFGSSLGSEVDQHLEELVYPFREHFIGYDASPLLDEFFFGLALGEVQTMEGFDTFHFTTRFGRVRFQEYMLAVVFFVSLSMRHVRFAEALVRKHPAMQIENLLTISSETQGLVESLRDAINYFGAGYESFNKIDLDDARQIFEVLSISRRNADLLERPGCALPLLVQCSEEHVIRCLTGAHEAPVQFLLDSLRHRFPREYDRNQQSREKAMQGAIKRILRNAFDGLLFEHNIKIRSSRRQLTDIDIVVIEKATGVIVLCQLKHQDLYGSDLHSRHVRTTRLKEQSARWLAAIASWRAEVGDAGMLASLKLPKSFPLSAVYRVVIAKHYAYALKEIAGDMDVAYANWTQLVNSVELLKQRTSSGGHLSDLVATLKANEAPHGPKEYLPEPDSHWQLYSLKFMVRQERKAPPFGNPTPENMV